jgi:hypothetical protein
MGFVVYLRVPVDGVPECVVPVCYCRVPECVVPVCYCSVPVCVVPVWDL